MQGVVTAPACNAAMQNSSQSHLEEALDLLQRAQDLDTVHRLASLVHRGQPSGLIPRNLLQGCQVRG